MDRQILQALKLAAVLSVLVLAAAVDGKTVTVGGSNKWTLGPNYAGWASGAGPFQVGDTLVFSYGGRAGKAAATAHNVYLMNDLAHYQRCDFNGAVLLADSSTSGYRFTIKQKRAHYFGCGVANGLHCQAGMKFAVNPR